MIEEEIIFDLSKLQPGARFWIYYGKNRANNFTGEVRAIVDDDQVVFRVWSRRWKSWKYKVETIDYFEIAERHGVLFFSRPTEKKA